MRKFKKVLTMVLAFALVICLTVAATVAYLTDKTTVARNTFTLGKVQIRLSEAKVNDKNENTDKDATGDIWDKTGTTLRSTRTDTGNKEVVTGNDGKLYGYALVPGRTAPKDPVVTVLANSEESYVRMKVTLDHASEIAAIFAAHVGKDFTLGGEGIDPAIQAVQTFFVDYNPAIWKADGYTIADNTITVTFNYIGTEFAGTKTGTVAKNTDNTDLEPIITGVTLPPWVTSEEAAVFTDGFGVDIVAEAIQAEGFDDADAAWDAFDAQTTTTGD